MSGGDKVSTALGETAVDYCVGRPVDQASDAGHTVWPVFVLWADGGVFCVQTGGMESSGGDGSWKVLGPIDVLPEQEHDYSQVDRKLLGGNLF